MTIPSEPWHKVIQTQQGEYAGEAQGGKQAVDLTGINLFVLFVKISRRGRGLVGVVVHQ